jgi:hypothetical protein
VRIAGKRVQDQDGIALLRVQRAIRFVGDLHRRERGAASEAGTVSALPSSERRRSPTEDLLLGPPYRVIKLTSPQIA